MTSLSSIWWHWWFTLLYIGKQKNWTLGLKKLMICLIVCMSRIFIIIFVLSIIIDEIGYCFLCDNGFSGLDTQTFSCSLGGPSIHCSSFYTLAWKWNCLFTWSETIGALCSLLCWQKKAFAPSVHCPDIFSWSIVFCSSLSSNLSNFCVL